MRSLHLLSNTSSLISATVGALREIGEEAYGLVYAKNWAQSNDANHCEVITEAPKSNRLLRHWRKVKTATRAIRYIKDVDVVHWYNGFAAWNSLDLVVAKRIGKKGIVEFLGGDIRNCEIASQQSPYYAAAWASGKYEYTDETAEHSREMQHSFLSRGVKSVVNHLQTSAYLIPGWEQKFDNIRVRVDLSKFDPKPVETDVSEPLIVHMTTAPVCKGTPQVEACLDQLRANGARFQYQRIQGMQRDQVLDWIGKCDLFLDNFIIGDGLPVGAIEAMAMAKPVISFSRSDVIPLWHREPEMYVNASLEQLPDAVLSLLGDGQRRRELGLLGREYVEEVHDARVQARKLTEVYHQLRTMG